MKIRLLILFLIIITSGITAQAANTPIMEDVKLETRGYDVIEVPAGTFIPVLNNQEISTQTCPDGFKVRFTSTNDLYMHDTNIIPEDTAFYGFVEEVHDPVIGTNASMKIRITKMVYPDGFESPIRGYIYTSNNNLIGGELTAPAEWRKMPHYQRNIGNNMTLQIRAGRTRKMGTHARVPAGERSIIILTDSAWITHTVTN